MLFEKRLFIRVSKSKKRKGKLIMVALILVFAAIGLLGVLCNIVIAMAHVICWLMKYIILPLGLLWCICYIKRYGL